MVEQANELILDILPLSAQTARLVRVYGTAPCVALPGTLPAPAGGPRGENPIILDNEKEDRKIDPSKFLNWLMPQIEGDVLSFVR